LVWRLPISALGSMIGDEAREPKGAIVACLHKLGSDRIAHVRDQRSAVLHNTSSPNLGAAEPPNTILVTNVSPNMGDSI
jgi:hypothetical protein